MIWIGDVAYRKPLTGEPNGEREGGWQVRWSAGIRLNLLVGVVITGLISVLTLGLLLNEYHRPAFAPGNAWLWAGMVGMVLLGFVISLLGLRRRIGCGHSIWSQLVLCFLISSVYIGWYRRELDYVKMGPDPDALDRSPPTPTLSGFVILLLAWGVIGFLPLAIRQSIRWYRARSSSRKDAPATPESGS